MLVKKSLDLFSFLKEFSTLRSKPIRNLSTYENVFWIADIMQTDVCEVFSKIWDEIKEHHSGAWIYVQKPQIVPEPKVPIAIEKWVIREGNELEPKLLTELVEIADGENVIYKVEEFSEVQKEYRDYYRLWTKWHDRDLEIRTVQRIFNALFNLYQQQKYLGELYELVIAFGCFTWKSPSYGEVKRHLITAQVSLFFDMDKAAIMLMPHEDGLKLLLEEDMLDPGDRPPVDESKIVQEALEELDEEIWTSGSLHDWLKRWMNSLQGPNGYNATFLERPIVSSQPNLSFSPALIMRRRSAKGFVRVFDSICAQINETGNVPEGIANFLGHEKSSVTKADGLSSSTYNFMEQVGEIYFPLPANDEQKQILQVLVRSQGVLVQGPPGTGKSQTIANLMCHLLATGKRVLVTSHTSRALEVLKDKLPEAIAPLCVDAIDDNPRSSIRLEESVQKILEQQSRWGKADQEKISHLSTALDNYRRQQAKCMNDLRAIREQDVFVHTSLCNKYSGTLEQIILQLQAEKELFDWMDPYEITEEKQHPLTNQEMRELLGLMREFDSTMVEKLSKLEIHPETFKTPDEVKVLITRYFESRNSFQIVEKLTSTSDYGLFKNISREERSAFYDSLNNFKTIERKIFSHPKTWVLSLAHTIRNGNKHLAQQLLLQTLQQLDEVKTLTENLDNDTCTGVVGYDINAVKLGAIKLRDHFSSGKGLRRFGIFKPDVIKENEYILQTIRVNDVPCNQVEQINTLIEWIEVQQTFEKIRNNCLALGVDFDGAYQQQQISFALKIAEVEECCRILGELLKHEKTIAELESCLQNWGRNEQVLWHEDMNVADGFIEILEAIPVEEDLEATQNKLNDFIDNLREMRVETTVEEYVWPIVDAAIKMNATGYEKAYKSYIENWGHRHRMNRMMQLIDSLDENCSSLRYAIASTVHNTEWDTKLGEFEAAWKWKRMKNWVDKMVDPNAVERFTENLHVLKKNIDDTLGELAGQKAWEYCIQRIRQNNKQSAALIAWQKTVKSIGKGTGKNAERYRREARGYMELCRSAIPAWIMPLYRVADTIECSPKLFDVVIIDEASQSGPEALLLQYIANKIVVVGDDKQISPQFVGIDKEEVNILRNRYLKDIEHCGRIGTENSFFDLADIKFGHRICLREHFRCMPEIIQFSNSQFYLANPLIPLKQYGQGRLSPTLMTVRVEDGYQKGSSPRIINEPEAKVVAAKIRECCNDPRYQNKTFGVISLLGDAQANIIMRLLQKEIGPEEIDRRKIICGDAYAFQGDERDVIFLSMVTSPAGDAKYRALTSYSDEQRFNVATSRAKEQLWLIHSATLNDLNSNCLRHRLLSYMQNPTVQQQTVGNLKIDELRIAASRPYRGNQVIPTPFQSWFEIDVFLCIVEKGFRVIPQHIVGQYQIDMIVEGLKGRLAVECDGDHWHGPERYEQDMGRQRQLERSGYIFWRIRSSVYYVNPGKAMKELWGILEINEIKAGVAADEQNVGIITITSESLRIEADLEETHIKPSDNLENLNPIKPEEPNKLPVESLVLPKPEKQNNRFLLQGEIVKPKEPVYETPKIVKAFQPIDNGDDLRQVTYQQWQASQTMLHPDYCKQADLISGLLEIVKVEGPIICSRLYSLYANAAGINKVGHNLRTKFNKAVYSAITSKKLLSDNELDEPGQLHVVVRMPETPKVMLRTRGNRDINDIPLREIALAMRQLAVEKKMFKNLLDDIKQDKSKVAFCKEFFRETLCKFDLIRLTDHTQERLIKALGLATERMDEKQIAIKTEDRKVGWCRGEMIEHKLFGRGVVEKVNVDNSGNVMLEVTFYNAGSKTILANKSPIEKLKCAPGCIVDGKRG